MYFPEQRRYRFWYGIEHIVALLTQFSVNPALCRAADAAQIDIAERVPSQSISSVMRVPLNKLEKLGDK